MTFLASILTLALALPPTGHAPPLEGEAQEIARLFFRCGRELKMCRFDLDIATETATRAIAQRDRLLLAPAPEPEIRHEVPWIYWASGGATIAVAGILFFFIGRVTARR
jgi:hypothetical protein